MPSTKSKVGVVNSKMVVSLKFSHASIMLTYSEISAGTLAEVDFFVGGGGGVFLEPSVGLGLHVELQVLMMG